MSDDERLLEIEAERLRWRLRVEEFISWNPIDKPDQTVDVFRRDATLMGRQKMVQAMQREDNALRKEQLAIYQRLAKEGGE